MPQESFDKFEARKKLKFEIQFVGYDWYDTERWE